MGLIYLDACALIDAREKSTPESQALVNLIAQASGADTPFITSDLSLVEVLAKPIQGLMDQTPERENPTKRADHDWYLGNLIPDGLLFRTRPLHRDILLQAAIMRARNPSLKNARRHSCCDGLSLRLHAFCDGRYQIDEKHRTR
ncbi:hypothetical protein ABIE41_004767 [Bosea sp. OAE506]|uniref:hypothetical protein n=1 Tax=Bosea sp. OAE506 TaxID=2663870 RepID=UPI00178B1081